MRINTNVASLTAQEAAKNTARSQTSSLEKLGTGLAINKASDDGSGLAIADKLRTQATSIGQSISNANSASALVNIADKAMSEQSNILDTIKSKLIQAGTDTTTDDGREAIRKDITKLLEQFDNIASQTNYNGMTLLQKAKDDTSTADAFNFQIGEDASYDISLKTDRAANTENLGASEEIPVDADATLSYGSQGALNIAADGTSITVQNNNTATTDTKAIAIGSLSNNNNSGLTVATDVSIEVTAKDVEFISMNAVSADSTITLETSDASTISMLNAMAQDNGNLTKVSDGTYTFGGDGTATGMATLEFTGKVDLTDLKISGITVDPTTAAGTNNDAIYIGTDSTVNIEKTSGAVSLNVSAAEETAGAGGPRAYTNLDEGLTATDITNADGLSTGTGAGTVVIDSGTVTMKVDQTTAALADAAIAIGTKTTGSSDTSEAAFTVSSTNVEKLTLTDGTNTASVTLSSSDADTLKKLEEIAQFDANLTSIGDGSFQFTATAAAANAVLDFGSEGVDLSNLKIAGLGAGAEDIYIQTDDAVTVTKNGAAGDLDITVQGADGTTVGQRAQSVKTDSASISGSLAELKSLKEGELTSDVANEMMSTVDNALTQLNSIRSDFGSTQNQLESSIRNLETTFTNIKAAESVIRDVDYAKESASFNKQNIIAQAGTYAMSQANAMQQNVSRLLQ